jgi:alpha-1,3-rhamnosyl/mannosyltransferase
MLKNDVKLNKNTIRIAIDATGLAPGGGLTVSIRLWECWCRKNAVELHVWYSRLAVAQEVKQKNLSIVLYPFMVGQPIWKVFLARQFLLGRQMMAKKPDIVMGINFMVRNISCPQLVHQQNLSHFQKTVSHPWKRILKGQIVEGFKDLFCRESVKKASGNVYISNYLRGEALSIVPKTKGYQEVIYNPISRNMFDSTNLHFERGLKPNILAVSNDSEHKDYPTLFRALGILKRLRPDINWNLRVAGVGAWDRYQSLLEVEHIENSVKFLGFCDSRTLSQEYQNAFCLVYQSRLEGFGVPPLEAMAYNCPVIASDCTAIPEVTGDAAILVEPGNSEAFSEAVMKLWDQPEIRETYVNKGKKRIVQFRLDTIAMDMFDLLLRISSQ